MGQGSGGEFWLGYLIGIGLIAFAIMGPESAAKEARILAVFGVVVLVGTAAYKAGTQDSWGSSGPLQGDTDRQRRGREAVDHQRGKEAPDNSRTDPYHGEDSMELMGRLLEASGEGDEDAQKTMEKAKEAAMGVLIEWEGKAPEIGELAARVKLASECQGKTGFDGLVYLIATQNAEAYFRSKGHGLMIPLRDVIMKRDQS